MRNKFLQRLSGGAPIELRAIRRGQVVGRALARDINKVDQFCADHAEAEVYFGAAPRIGLGGLDACAHLTHLWVDIDFKDTPESEAREGLALIDWEPEIIVHSGGGLHCYWRLEEPLEPRDAGPALKWIARLVGGDARSAEAAHILRLPGTMNHKYSPPRPVKVEAMSRGDAVPPMAWGDHARADKEEIDSRFVAGDAALARARAWIAERVPAVEGSGGDDWTFQTACALVRDHGLTEDAALELMREWNKGCLPPWDDADLARKVRGAMKYGTGAVGSEDPAADFAELGESVIVPPETLMQKMDKWFRAVDEDGKLRVYARRRDDALNRNYWVRYARRDFLDVCRSVKKFPMIECGQKADGSPRVEEAGLHWLDHHSKKRSYSGVAFAPEHDGDKTPDGKLNMWQGFAIRPKVSGSWEYLKELIFETLCGMECQSYEYVVSWLARAAQRPWEPGGTALVFRGPKGTGKSTLGRTFVRLFGQHGMHVSSPSLLTGRFNIHLRDVVALFADEAFWAGDKTGEGILKGLITEPTLAYEGKGRDVETGRNCVHLIMASNEEWVVPAGLDGERRFAVFGVEDDRRDRGYWVRLNAELNSGGLAHMLMDLLARDIDGFDPHAVPATRALIEQKVRTASPTTAWLIEAAENNWEDFGEAHGSLDIYQTDEVYNSYLRYCDRRGLRAQRHSREALGLSLKRLVPGLAKRRILLGDGRQQRYFYALPTAEEVLRRASSLGYTEQQGENPGTS